MLRHVPLLLLLLGLPLPAGSREPARPTLSPWDIEGMYVRAKATLEDRSTPNVESVPVLLDTCFRAGYAPAARLLLDVYEGKFKGLAEKPEQAYETVSEITQNPEQYADNEDWQHLRREALFRMALYAEKGYGCTADPAAAVRCMTQAAEEGLGVAKAELARYLMMGQYTEQQPQRAWALLHDQAKKDPFTPHVFYYMGYMCYRGIGHRSDPHKAALIFKKGVQAGDADCMNNLGAMCEKGITMPANADLALALYRMAAAMGHKQASANLQRLSYKEGARATKLSATPPSRRISNALLHIVQALPFSDATKNSMKRRLEQSPAATRR